MPSPKCALRWLAFSPVPSHTTSEFFGSTATQHSVNDPPLSKTGVNVVPRLMVFHNPPNAVATYHVLADFGSMAMSCTRPVWMAGPMLRNSSPLSTSAVRRSAPPAGACPPVLIVAMTAKAAIAAISVVGFMARDSVRIRLRGQLSVSIFVKRFVLAASLFITAGAFPVSCAHHVAPAAKPAAAPAASTPPPQAAAQPVAPATAPAPSRTGLPERLTDAQFWELSQTLSEPGGSFRSDNLLSNEVWLQYVIPDLLTVNKPGRVYMGVGPEQNFTYIAALKPAMVFIVDVRRGNLDLHLMYKALFDMSSDRVDFVSKLFSRKRPDGLTASSSVREMFQAFASVPADEVLFEQNFKAIIDNLQKTHNLPLMDEDIPGIRYVYEYFGRYGPDLTYWMSGGFGGRGGGRNSPTYADLMV